MPPQMTSAVRRRGYLNMLIYGPGVLAVLGLLTFGVSAFTGRTWDDSTPFAFAIFWTTSFAAFMLSFLVGRAKRGTVLLDCGQHPMRRVFLINAAIFGLQGLGSLLAPQVFDLLVVATAWFGITFSSFWIIMSLGRLQFTENGIWQYWSLLKWEKLHSCDWQEGSTPTLTLQSKTPLPFLGRGALPVPAEHREAVAELLKQHASNAGTTANGPALRYPGRRDDENSKNQGNCYT